MKDKEGFSFGNTPDKPFVLHQNFEEPSDTKQVKCSKCGRSTLEVGKGSYYTVIRCPDCGHESCIHEG